MSITMCGRFVSFRLAKLFRVFCRLLPKSANAAFGLLDKFAKFQDHPGRRLGPNFSCGLTHVQTRLVQGMKCPLDGQPIRRTIPSPTQANHIQTRYIVAGTHYRAKRRQILAERTIAGNHGQFANAAELMNRRIAADDRAVANIHVARQ